MRRSTELLQLFSQAELSNLPVGKASNPREVPVIHCLNNIAHFKQQSPIKYKSREPTWNLKILKDWWFVDRCFPFPKEFEVEMWVFMPWFLGTRLCYPKPFREMQWVYLYCRYVWIYYQILLMQLSILLCKGIFMPSQIGLQEGYRDHHTWKGC